jgi:hypothetical protein
MRHIMCPDVSRWNINRSEFASAELSIFQEVVLSTYKINNMLSIEGKNKSIFLEGEHKGRVG